jgi:hypothetical protein
VKETNNSTSAHGNRTEGTAFNNTHRISDRSYAKAIKGIGSSVGIATKHFVHIGRVLGSKESEMMEDDDDLRRVLGNWDPKQNKRAYSNKLPMKIIRQKAGFCEADGMYYNPGVTFSPPKSLKDRLFSLVDSYFFNN